MNWLTRNVYRGNWDPEPYRHVERCVQHWPVRCECADKVVIVTRRVIEKVRAA